MNHSLDLYIELYKRGVYDSIPVGSYPSGEYFYPTGKQVETLKLLNNSDTSFVGYGGSARCFTGDTLVQTSKGHIQISDIKEGDYVLSLNEETKTREFKKVLKRFRFYCAEPPNIAIFENGIKCTEDHEFLFRGEWTKASKLRERAMEASRKPLLHFNQRAFSNIKPQKHWSVKTNEAIKRCEQLLQNNDFNQWEVFNGKNSSFSSSSFYSESRKQASGKPYRFRQVEQLYRESRVEHSKRKCYTLSKSRKVQCFQERGKTTSELFEKRRGQWISNIKRERCFRNKGKIQTENLHSSNVSRGIRCKSMHDKGCNTSEVLESREITIDEIKGLKFEAQDVFIYDLHVEDNHNYTVTKENIIVHNSGKSLIECTAIIFDCLAYDGIGWGLARKELTTLKRTVLLTLFKQFEFYGITEDDYNYNQQLNRIDFNNGSTIFLIDTAYKPSDPLNTRFGGFELTRCAIDESNETNEDVILKLYERTGWRKNDTYNLKRKMFECFNPAKNHVYKRYYKPFRDSIQDIFKQFIPALPSDNPHPSVKEWITDIIKTGDTVTIERQVNGNFDYDDDPTVLCNYDAIEDLFTNSHIQGGNKYISADLAMKGRDKFVAGYWEGRICSVAIDMNKSSARDIELKLKELKTVNRVGNSQIVADSDGLGAYLESYIRNIKAFHGGARPIDPKTYGIIKDQCGFKLAELINKRLIRIKCSREQEEAIKEELSICLKQDNLNADKKRLIKKDKQKELLGRSPDYLDMLLMRMIFEIVKKQRPIKIIGR